MPVETAEHGPEPTRSPSVDSQLGIRAAERRPRKVAWLAVAALAALALGFAAFSLLQAPRADTPEGALEQMADAVRDGDWDGVQACVDVEAVAGAYIDTALSNASGGDSTDSAGSGSGMGGNSTPPGPPQPGLGDTMRAAFTTQFTTALKRLVKNKGMTESGEVAPLLLVGDPAKIEEISETEAVATVAMPDTAGELQDVSVRLAKAEDGWHITAFENLDDLMGLLN